jgi:hypothetical protein
MMGVEHVVFMEVSNAAECMSSCEGEEWTNKRGAQHAFSGLEKGL